MSLLGQAKPGRRRRMRRRRRSHYGRVPHVVRGGAIMMKETMEGLSHSMPASIGKTVQPGHPSQIQKIQSRNSKTACFVFCSFHCLTLGKRSSGSRDPSAAGPPSV